MAPRFAKITSELLIEWGKKKEGPRLSRFIMRETLLIAVGTSDRQEKKKKKKASPDKLAPISTMDRPESLRRGRGRAVARCDLEKHRGGIRPTGRRRPSGQGADPKINSLERLGCILV